MDSFPADGVFGKENAGTTVTGTGNGENEQSWQASFPYPGPPPPYTAAPEPEILTGLAKQQQQQRSRSPPYHLRSNPNLWFYFNTGAAVGGTQQRLPALVPVTYKAKLNESKSSCTIQLHEEPLTAVLDLREESLRLASIRKAYALLSFQLLVTAAVIALFVTQAGLKHFIQRHAFHVYATFLATFVVVLCPCCGYGNRGWVVHLFCLGALTLATDLVLAEISTRFRIDDVQLSASVAVVIFVGLTIFASQVKLNFTRLTGILYAVWLASIILTFAVLFFQPYIPISLGLTRQIYTGISVLLFASWLVCQTQLIFRTKQAEWPSLSPDEDFVPTAIFMNAVFIWLNLLFFVESVAVSG